MVGRQVVCGIGSATVKYTHSVTLSGIRTFQDRRSPLLVVSQDRFYVSTVKTVERPLRWKVTSLEGPDIAGRRSHISM